VIKEVFLQVLQGVHHPRIQYPEPIKKATIQSGTVHSARRRSGGEWGQRQGYSVAAAWWYGRACRCLMLI
jgi:hypothetical protein